MNFPMENPFFQFAYWLVNTPPLGGLAVGAVAALSITAYGLALRWIIAGGKEPAEVYAYPTPALHRHAEEPRTLARRR